MERFILERWEIIKSYPEVFIAIFLITMIIVYLFYRERISGYKNTNTRLNEQLQSLQHTNAALGKESAERQKTITELVKYNKTLKSQLEQSQFEVAEYKAKDSPDDSIVVNPRTYRSDR